MDNCTLDCIETIGHLNFTQMCEFTQHQCIQDTVQFIQGYYCLFNGSFMMLAFFGVPLMLLLLKTLNVVAEYYLSPSVEQFIDQFKISPTLAGVTFLAFANGAPDVMTSIIAGSSSSSTTALIPFGSIFGACLFSTAFILSVVIFSQPNQTLQVKRKQVVAPVLFYIFGMILIIVTTTAYGKMNWIIASILLLAYAIYIAFVVKSQRKAKKHQSLLQSVSIQDEQKQNEQAIQKDEQTNGEKSQEKNLEVGILKKINRGVQMIQNFVFKRLIPPYNLQNWNPVNTVISLIASPFILILTQNVSSIKAFVGPIPVFLLVSLPAICLLCYTIFCIIKHQEPKIVKVFTLYSFLVSIAMLTLFCSILINLIQLLQILTGANPVFIGLTVLAWANSIGDYLTITHFARTSNPKTAVAGIFSGQLFNFLIGFGISLIIQSIDGQYKYKIFDFEGTTYDKISDAIVMTVIVAGLVYLALMLYSVIRNRGVLMRKQALIGKGYYIGFICIACILAVATDFFHEISCRI